MARRRYGILLVAALAASGLLRLAATAQEAEAEPEMEALETPETVELADEPPPPTEDLATLDADVIDATAEVEGTAAPAAPAAWAVEDDTPPDLGPYQVILHTDGNALVQRRRNVDLTVGENELTLDAVPTQIVADSIGLRALDPAAGLQVLEQSGSLSRPTMQSLLSASLGETIEVRDGGRQVAEGRLLASEESGLVVETSTGVHLLPLGGEVVLPVSALVERAPGLRWRTRAERAGSTEIEVSYLTGGFTWQADYALTARDSDRLVGFEAWVRVDNQSGADLAQAGLIFIDRPSAEPGDEPAAAGTARRYYLPQPVDLPDGEAKRFALVQLPAARSQVRYVATLEPAGLAGVRLTAELKNDAASGLGLPLPPGPARLYAPDRVGRLQLVGRQELSGVAVDAPLSFDLGPADDVDLQIETAAPEGGPIRRTVRLRNLRTEEITVRLVERRPGAWSMTAATTPFTPVRDGAATAEVTVPANGTAEVRYQIAVTAAETPEE